MDAPTLQSEEPTLESEDVDRYLTFTTDDMFYAFPIRNVTEIIGMQTITTVPDVPPFIKGVINLRGKVIPLMDVRLRLGLQGVEYNDRTCIIVVEVTDRNVGVIVDAVSDVLTIDTAQIEPPPDYRSGNDTHYISGMAKREEGIVVVLDAEELLRISETDTRRGAGAS
ncbi:MAG: chemotaxis protein CheW [Myxococcota bacterium]